MVVVSVVLAIVVLNKGLEAIRGIITKNLSSEHSGRGVDETCLSPDSSTQHF